MLRRIRLLAACAALAMGAAAAAPQTTPPPDTSTRALVEAASRYVARYQQDFAFLLADEAYTQNLTDAAGRLTRRRLTSEFFLTFLPADEEWVAVRDVKEVDGHPVAAREDVRALLAKGGDVRGLASQVIARNARYNIGRTSRNFNEPTLPLLLLSEKRVRDVHFTRRGLSRDGATVLATLAFEERGRATLVRGSDGAVPGTGEFLIEAGTGVIRQTTFTLTLPGVKVRLVTRYARDGAMDLWLPQTFTERYDAEIGRSAEFVRCEAAYSNYRRFDVTARIK